MMDLPVLELKAEERYQREQRRMNPRLDFRDEGAKMDGDGDDALDEGERAELALAWEWESDVFA